MKQVLYDTLQVQLNNLEEECKRYEQEVITPKRNEFYSQIENWFKTNINASYDKLNINENYISVYVNDNSIRLEGRPNGVLELRWDSGFIKEENNSYFHYIQVLSELSSNYPTIKNLYTQVWSPTWKEIDKLVNDNWSEFNNLKTALSSLKREIESDTKNEMLNPGFELSQFKPHYKLGWSYEWDVKKHRIDIEDKMLSLQIGRSRYDIISVRGFKVLGKKGNKYEVEVTKYDRTKQTYKVLEKKFKHFINVVNEWESVEADRLKEIAEKSNSLTQN